MRASAMRHVIGRVFAAVPVLASAAPVAYSPAHSVVGLIVLQVTGQAPIGMVLVREVLAELATPSRSLALLINRRLPV
jgi:hypothetical protein